MSIICSCNLLCLSCFLGWKPVCACVCDEAPVGRSLPPAHPPLPVRSCHVAGQPRSVQLPSLLNKGFGFSSLRLQWDHLQEFVNTIKCLLWVLGSVFGFGALVQSRLWLMQILDKCCFVVPFLWFGLFDPSMHVFLQLSLHGTGGFCDVNEIGPIIFYEEIE